MMNDGRNVKVRVDHDGVWEIMFIDDVARKMRTTSHTVIDWCVGNSTPPEGYKVSYADVNMRGGSVSDAPSEKSRRMYANAKARVDRDREENVTDIDCIVRSRK